MTSSVFAMNDVVNVEISRRATTGDDTREVIAMEHLATDRSGHRRLDARDLVALQIADVIGIAEERSTVASSTGSVSPAASIELALQARQVVTAGFFGR